MAMSKALLEDTLTRYLTTGTPDTRPTAWEISLHTGDPGDDGLDNEVGDTAYVRQAVSMSVSSLDPKASNSAVVSFPAAAEGFTATHVVIWGDGTMPLDIQQLRTSRVIAVGETATFAVGEYTIGGV
jgi:hypothetical protein